MFCLKEPDSFCGGETVLLKNQDLTAILDPEVISKFEEKKVRYQAFLPNKTTDAGLQKSWQDRFCWKMLRQWKRFLNLMDGAFLGTKIKI